MKRRSKLILIMLLGLASSVFWFPIQEAEAAGWLTGWQRRRPITIDNSTNISALTNYQVRVELTAANFDFTRANLDGSDIRFTDSDGITLINFWIERWDATARIATIWVRVPSIDGRATKMIYIYFGNPGALSASNGPATFDFFDGFKGTTIDTTRWNIVDATGWSVAGGELRGTNTTGRLTSVPMFSAPIIQELRLRTVTVAPNGQTVGGFWLSSVDGLTLLAHRVLVPDPIGPRNYIRNDATWTRIGDVIPVGNVPFLLTFTAAGTAVTVTCVRLDTGATTYTGSFTNTTLNERIMLGRRADDGNLGQAYDTFWDWIRVRRHTSPEPSTAVGVEQGAPPDRFFSCFIATAAFGTPMAEEVVVLSRFRDRYLLTNELGRRFVSFYYQHSPALAEYISDREWAKRIVRITLSPLVRIAELIVGGEEDCR